MPEATSRTLVCSVLFVDLEGYSRTSVSEQMRLKQGVNALIVEALERVRQWDRVILDTGDGAAVAFLGDPEDALIAAMAIRDNAGELRLRMGVNLGPVRLVKDLNGQNNIVGDGINAAQRVMGFAEPGQLLVSRGFFDVLSRLSEAHARLFTHAGVRADKHVREHELYLVAGGKAPASTRPADGAARIFDAGPHLIVSGYDRIKVVKALDALAARGAKVVSPVSQVGEKWLASCEHPGARLDECKVEKLGYTTLVTGPTRQAVAAKVDELLRLGAKLQGEIEQDGELWSAACDTGGARR